MSFTLDFVDGVLGDNKSRRMFYPLSNSDILTNGLITRLVSSVNVFSGKKQVTPQGPVRLSLDRDSDFAKYECEDRAD